MSLHWLKVLALLIPLLPLVTWVGLSLGGRYLNRRLVGPLATVLSFIAFIISVYFLFRSMGAATPLRLIYGNWLDLPGFAIPFGLQLDELSITMALATTFVATLVNFYSIEFMRDDPACSRFFAWLNLSVASMLLTVLAENFVFMLVGWEGVALSTYLLIAFHYEKRGINPPIRAARKAFVIARIGDAALIVAILLLATSPLAAQPNVVDRSLSFDFISRNIASHMSGDRQYLIDLLPLLTMISALVFIGAAAMSGQFLFYFWVPDSVKAPAPANALMQSATTVAAGVYLIVRMHQFFLLSPTVMAIIAVLSALTALYGASVACIQTDMKRTLAWSTISQVGLMFLACAVGAFGAAIFHLVVHAFMKACLFLGVGSIIRGTGDITDLRKLGGLKQWMPVTQRMFFVATAALAGFPLLSGFFSGSTLLHETLSQPFAFGWNVLAGVIAAVALLGTVIYSYRLYYKAFEGDFNGPTGLKPKESGWIIAGVLYILGGLAVVAGFAGFPIPGLEARGTYLTPIFDNHVRQALEFWGMTRWFSHPYVFLAISTLLFIGGFGIARRMYLVSPELQLELKVRHQRIYRALWEGFRLEEAFQAVFARPGLWFCGLLWRWMDEAFIDRGLVEGTGKATGILAGGARLFQNGYVRTYALYMLLGIALLIWLASL